MRKVRTTVVLVLLGLAGSVSAEPGDYASRGLTLQQGTFQIHVPVVLNLSKNKVLRPVWIPFDLSYGVTDQLTVFLNHSSLNGPIMGGRGVCIGEKPGCYKVYNSLNLGAQYSLMRLGRLELSGIGAVQARTLDQGMRLALDVGVGLKYVADSVSIRVTPQLGMGMNKRDNGNTDFIEMPVQVAFQATPKLAIFLDTGLNGQLNAFAATYLLPMGLGAAFAALPNLDVGAEFMLPHALSGMKGDNATDVRTFAVFASYRL